MKELGSVATLGAERKDRLSLTIRKIDNGYLLEVHKETDGKYEDVEIAVMTLPKLLKAIGTFLKNGVAGEGEGE